MCVYLGHVQSVRYQQGIHLLPGASAGADWATRAASRSSPQTTHVCPHSTVQASCTHFTWSLPMERRTRLPHPLSPLSATPGWPTVLRRRLCRQAQPALITSRSEGWRRSSSSMQRCSGERSPSVYCGTVHKRCQSAPSDLLVSCSDDLGQVMTSSLRSWPDSSCADPDKDTTKSEQRLWTPPLLLIRRIKFAN